jgi:hypothetical protein
MLDSHLPHLRLPRGDLRRGERPVDDGAPGGVLGTVGKQQQRRKRRPRVRRVGWRRDTPTVFRDENVCPERSTRTTSSCRATTKASISGA